jgi:hypothetical protein
MHVARIGRKGIHNGYRSERRTSLGRPRHLCGDSNRVNLGEKGRCDVDWIHLVLDSEDSNESSGSIKCFEILQ